MGDVGVNDENFHYLSSLPKTAIQAIYHAVTGRTENLSKWLHGNVIVKNGDFSRLHAMLQDQWNIHPLLADPTTTIIVNTEHDRKIQYSSWPRFQALQIESKEITSDIVLRIEFVTELPNTSTPQRCVININIDSALPLIDSIRKESDDSPPPGFFLVIGRNWRTVEVSIDFVDYVLAKNFLSVVDEWFKSLEKIPDNRVANYISKNSHLMIVFSAQTGRIGAAFFLLTYYLLMNSADTTLLSLFYPASLCLLTWSIVQAVSTQIIESARKKASRNILPSCIILTEGDRKAFENAISAKTSSAAMGLQILGGALFAVVLNVLASYIFVWLHP